jgi:hypothetical protein
MTMLNGSFFRIDDVVKVVGYNGRLFRIIIMTYKTKYIYGVYYQGFIYKVIDIVTSEILDDVFEEDLILYARKAEKDKPTLTYEQIKWQEYEDNLTLYEIFGDEKYQDAAVNIYCELIHNRDN